MFVLIHHLKYNPMSFKLNKMLLASAIASSVFFGAYVDAGSNKSEDLAKILASQPDKAKSSI
ncbi:MAG: hypothetical protein ACJAS9_001094 [Polaribacter sp.]|jgi:hypothetical protein